MLSRDRHHGGETNVPLKTGIYVRISTVDAAGNETATARQEADCRELVARDGDELVRVYRDVDRSAYDLSVERPAFEEMLRDASQGDLQRIVAWKWDRLCRSLLDAGRLHQLVEVNGVDVNTVTDPISGWGSASAALEVGIRAGLGAGESKSTSTRLRRVNEERAAQGLPHAGGRRGFGMKPGHLEIDDAEAALIRAAARSALDGESLTSIARGWNELGVRTTRDGEWNVSNLRRLLIAPHVAGRRMFRGEVVESDVIPAILDDETWHALCGLLNDPARSTRHGAEMNRPLSGVVRCGTCGTVMTPRTRRSEGLKPSYVCRKEAGNRACGARSIAADPLDELVLEAIVAYLGDDPLEKALANRDDAGDAELADRIIALRQAREDAISLFADGHLSRSELLAVQAKNADAIEPLEAELARRGGSRAVGLLGPGETVLQGWETHGPAWRRALVRAVVSSVDIAPASKRGVTRFETNRVSITFTA
jgi:DNA invertase Pin-like site-specific DNA recombinase